MATKFPSPSMNHLIDEDPMIVKVPMDHTEFGARRSAQPKDIKNSMTIVHVGREVGPGRMQGDVETK